VHEGAAFRGAARVGTLVRMTKRTQAIWAERVREWRASGLSAEAFVEGKDYRGSSLRWADARLRAGGSRSSDGPADAGASRSPRFVPLRARASEPQGAVVVEVGPARVHVSAGFSVALLGEVVRALAASGR
jgi:hypothetical protein